jgi:hypothetical protein
MILHICLYGEKWRTHIHTHTSPIHAHISIYYHTRWNRKIKRDQGMACYMKIKKWLILHITYVCAYIYRLQYYYIYVDYIYIYINILLCTQNVSTWAQKRTDKQTILYAHAKKVQHVTVHKVVACRGNPHPRRALVGLWRFAILRQQRLFRAWSWCWAQGAASFSGPKKGSDHGLIKIMLKQ